MKISHAKITDAPVIHNLMIRAFMAYKDEIPPSSALEETIQSLAAALNDGEQALIGSLDEEPVGMVRFRVKEDYIYFYRLAVPPEKQGQGIAKKLLQSLEAYALEQKKSMIQCKVRLTVPKNIALYQSIGYEMYDEETIYRANDIALKVVSMRKRLL